MLNRRVFITLLEYDVRITAVCVYDAKKKSRLSNIVRTSLEQNYSVLVSLFHYLSSSLSFRSLFFSFFILDYHLALYVVFMHALREAKLPAD